VPAEFVIVADTNPTALASPASVKGICRRNALPALCPAALANQLGAFVPRGTENLEVPLNCAPDAASNVRSTEVKSRGVEFAWSSTVNPDAVTLTMRTEPGTMIGATRGTVIEPLGAGLGN